MNKSTLQFASERQLVVDVSDAWKHTGSIPAFWALNLVERWELSDEDAHVLSCNRSDARCPS